MSKQRRNGVARSLGGDIFITVVLIVVAAFMMLPFVYAIMQSLKPIEEIFIFPPRFFVINPTLSNYLTLSKLTDSLWVPFSRYLVNSVVVTIAGTGFNLVVASMAAFPLAKYPFPGSKWLFRLVTTSLLFAGPVTALPQYIIVAKMGLINTLWSVILPAVGLPLGLFLMRNFMTQIPDGMLEAARIDGAGEARTFVNIVFPMIKPGVGALAIFTFITAWNDYFLQLIMLNDMDVLTISLGIAKLQSELSTDYGLIMAGAALGSVPIILIFLMFQKFFTRGITMGAVKG